eukprot:820095-Rhodomonas_salina.2
MPETLRYKIFEPVLLVGTEKFKEVDIMRIVLRIISAMPDADVGVRDQAGDRQGHRGVLPEVRRRAEQAGAASRAPSFAVP